MRLVCETDLLIDAATPVIEIMAQLDTIKPQIDQLTHRIDAMKSDGAEYGQAMEALAPLAGAALPDNCPQHGEKLGTGIGTGPSDID